MSWYDCCEISQLRQPSITRKRNMEWKKSRSFGCLVDILFSFTRKVHTYLSSWFHWVIFFGIFQIQLRRMNWIKWGMVLFLIVKNIPFMNQLGRTDIPFRLCVTSWCLELNKPTGVIALYEGEKQIKFSSFVRSCALVTRSVCDYSKNQTASSIISCHIF